MTATERACGVCGNHRENALHIAREMMLGLGTKHPYLECGFCGCLSLVEIPDDLDRFYPQDYYSFRVRGGAIGAMFASIRRHRVAETLEGDRVGRILNRFLGDPVVTSFTRVGKIDRGTKLLDVGAGRGDRVEALRACGVAQAHGIDPFLPAGAVDNGKDPVVTRRDIWDVVDNFDVVLFNHSFEHMDRQEEVLRAARALLRSGGRIIIRTPVAGTYAWRTYGVNWVQLDAPRHLTVHSEMSLRMLAERCGLSVTCVEYDSTPFQLWGSDMYRSGAVLTKRPLSRRLPLVDLFSRAGRSQRRRSAELNTARDGDQATFLLEPME